MLNIYIYILYVKYSVEILGKFEGYSRTARNTLDVYITFR